MKGSFWSKLGGYKRDWSIRKRVWRTLCSTLRILKQNRRRPGANMALECESWSRNWMRHIEKLGDKVGSLAYHIVVLSLSTQCIYKTRKNLEKQENITME
jgi:hypothetical protein